MMWPIAVQLLRANALYAGSPKKNIICACGAVCYSSFCEIVIANMIILLAGDYGEHYLSFIPYTIRPAYAIASSTRVLSLTRLNNLYQPCKASRTFNCSTINILFHRYSFIGFLVTECHV